MAEAQSSADARPVAQGVFDLVVANGRVIDPETGLDGVRSVGIRNGRIAAISRTPLRGRTMLDATGLVVAPGFIDLQMRYVIVNGTAVIRDGTLVREALPGRAIRRDGKPSPR